MFTEKLGEIKDRYEGQYVELEVYESDEGYGHYPTRFHTDNCRVYEGEISDDLEIGLEDLMDEEEYDNTILANGCIKADFDAWYGNKNAKVLCVMVTDNQRDSLREN